MLKHFGVPLFKIRQWVAKSTRRGAQMISDVLYKTVNNLDYYMNKSDFHNTYTVEVRDRLVRFRNEAKAIQDILVEPLRPASV